jgi:two-component system, OmpR family, response regulator
MPDCRILVVDDSELVHELARLALRRDDGWQVSCAASGADGVAQAQAERPDAVLLDVEMPQLDGPATVAALRELPACADVPIVFMTAHEDPAELERLRALGVRGILPKPFDVARLADQLAELLGRTP